MEDGDEIVDGWNADTRGRLNAVLGSGYDAFVLPPRGKGDTLYGIEVFLCGTLRESTAFDSLEECLDYAHHIYGMPTDTPPATVIDCAGEPGGLLHWLLKMRVADEPLLVGLLPALEDIWQVDGRDVPLQAASVGAIRGADGRAFCQAVAVMADDFVRSGGKLGCKPTAFAKALHSEILGHLPSQTKQAAVVGRACQP